MGRMIEEKINEEIKSFIYLNYKIIGYHYKGEIYFNHYSAENTIKAETNSKGQTKYFDYGFDSDFNEANVLYYGQYKDEFTGLYYNYHRDYSHQMKRYLQIDPLGLTDGTNPYIYVKNNALNYFDFYGLAIYLQTHPVSMTKYSHSKIVIYPEKKSIYYNDSRFQNIDLNEKKYGTIGGEPDTNLYFAGPLVGNINRNTDLIEYTLFPDFNSEEYNSNSFSHGILKSVGIHHTPIPSTNLPEWNNPVSVRFFKK